MLQQPGTDPALSEVCLSCPGMPPPTWLCGLEPHTCLHKLVLPLIQPLLSWTDLQNNLELNFPEKSSGLSK